MKHLSQAPAPPSTHRPEIPRDLDYVVAARAREGSGRPLPLGRGDGLRPRADRARDRRLRRDGRGGDHRCSPAPTRATATTIRLRPRREHDLHAGPLLRVRRAAAARASIWPWLLGALVVALALVGGWFAWQEVQSSSAPPKPVAVPDVVGVAERLAVQEIQDAGLKELVERTRQRRRPASASVFAQDPQPGDRTEQGNFVTINVSTGSRRRWSCPNVVGREPRRRRRSADAGRPEGERRSASTRSSPSTPCSPPARRRGPRCSRGRPCASTSRRGRSRSRSRTWSVDAVRERRIDPAGRRLRRLARRRGRCHAARRAWSSARTRPRARSRARAR